MARKLFERQAIRRRTGALATGVVMVVYTDAAGTAPADISTSSGGSAIPGSTVTTANIAGFGPAALQFWGPPDGTDTLYIKVPSDTSLGVQEIEASTDARLDVLEAAGGGDVGVHSADTTAVHGIADTAQVAIRNAENAFTLDQRIGASGRIGVGYDAVETRPAFPLQVRSLVNGGAAITTAASVPLAVQQKSTSTADFLGFYDSSEFLLGGVGFTGISHGAGTGTFAIHTRGGTGFGTAKVTISGDDLRINGRLGISQDPGAAIDTRAGVNFGNLATIPRPETRGLNALHGRAMLDADPEDIHGAMIIGQLTSYQSGASPRSVFGAEIQAETGPGAGVTPANMIGCNGIALYRSSGTITGGNYVCGVNGTVQIDDVSGTRAGTIDIAAGVRADELEEIGTLGTITTAIGIWGKAQTVGTHNWSGFFEGDTIIGPNGRLGVGFGSADAAPSRILHARSTNGAATTITDTAGAQIVAVQQDSASSVAFIAWLDSSEFLCGGFGVQNIGHGAGTGDWVIITRGAGFTTPAVKIPNAGGLVVGTAGALAASATNGFLYIPTVPTAPSGTPVAQTGTVAIVFNTGDNKLHVYDGGWLATAVLT